MKIIKIVRLRFILFTLFIIANFYLTLKAEVDSGFTITCPTGDKFTCYTMTEGGITYDIKKGRGKATITVKQKLLQLSFYYLLLLHFHGMQKERVSS
uniref:hypothetical protein n=2 Tax=Roseivirga sp. TaxID=1964215 RepID=UPI00404825BA